MKGRGSSAHKAMSSPESASLSKDSSRRLRDQQKRLERLHHDMQRATASRRSARESRYESMLALQALRGTSTPVPKPQHTPSPGAAGGYVHLDEPDSNLPDYAASTPSASSSSPPAPSSLPLHSQSQSQSQSRSSSSNSSTPSSSSTSPSSSSSEAVLASGAAGDTEVKILSRGGKGSRRLGSVLLSNPADRESILKKLQVRQSNQRKLPLTLKCLLASLNYKI